MIEASFDDETNRLSWRFTVCDQLNALTREQERTLLFDLMDEVTQVLNRRLHEQHEEIRTLSARVKLFNDITILVGALANRIADQVTRRMADDDSYGTNENEATGQ